MVQDIRHVTLRDESVLWWHVAGRALCLMVQDARLVALRAGNML